MSEDLQQIDFPEGQKHIESFEDPLQHLWAISYADLLMVILAFFVVFDVTPDDTQKSMPQLPDPSAVASAVDRLLPDLSRFMFGRQLELALDARKEVITDKPAQAIEDEHPKAPESESLGLADLRAMIENIVMLNKSHLDHHTSPYEIIIHFDADLFPLGSYTLTPSAETDIKRLLDVVSPHTPDVNVVFIGHTDSVPIGSGLRQRGIRSNMVLSSLRAAMAAELAVSHGFDPRLVTTKGHDYFDRSTRSLSIKIATSREGSAP